MAVFDVKQVTNYEWLGIGTGAVAIINSFLPWYSVSISMGALNNTEFSSAWSIGFAAWFSVLLVVAAAVVVLLPHFGVEVQRRPLVWLGLAGLAFALIILRWLTFPSVEASGGLTGEISAGASFGLFLGLILAIVSAVGGWLTYQARPAPDAAA